MKHVNVTSSGDFLIYSETVSIIASVSIIATVSIIGTVSIIDTVITNSYY